MGRATGTHVSSKDHMTRRYIFCDLLTPKVRLSSSAGAAETAAAVVTALAADDEKSLDRHRQESPRIPKGVEMLLAILYDDDGKVMASAPACDQQPLGNRYWEEIHPEQLNVRHSETAHVNIDDRRLVERLLKMDFQDGTEAAEAIDAYLGLSATTSL